MRILFLGPLPPPINGQSLASQVFYDDLKKYHDVDVIDLVKKSYVDGMDSFSRIFEIGKILLQVFKRKGKADVIYLQVSESLAGNIRDILIFLICYRKLNKTYVHLHGGSIKTLLFDRYKLLNNINRYFHKKMAGAIVLGQSHAHIYTPWMGENKVHVVNNFSEDYLYVTPEAIKQKFSDTEVLRILFMSNLIFGKGYNELADAYLQLSDEAKSKVIIDFAGAFESEEQKAAFLNKIKPYSNIYYHGIVNGEAKKKLFEEAHILCFPSYLFEGQGICVLEGYASGCAVITTGKSGISDIFQDKVNGYKIEEKSAESIKNVIEYILDHKQELEPYARYNHATANEKYRTSIFSSKLIKIVACEN